MTDSKVQIAHVVVDGMLGIGLMILIALVPSFAAVGIGLLGTLIGARATTAKSSKVGELAPASAGGAMAMLLVIGTMLGRAKGAAAVVAFAGLAAVGIASCTQTQRAGVIRVAGSECVMIQDPMGRALCVGAEELAILINEIAARKASTTGGTAIASTSSSATTAASATSAASAQP